MNDDESIFILLEAVRSMDAAGAEEFRALLAREWPAAAEALDEAEDAIAQLPLTLASVAPQPGLRQVLADRVAGGIGQARTGAATRVRVAQPRSNGRRGSWRYAAAAGWLIAAGLGVWAYTTARPQLAVLDAMRASAAKQDAAIDDARRLLGSSDVTLVSLQGQASQSQAGGRVFWDRGRREWRVYVFNLKPPAPGREYELWFIPPGQKPVPSKTFRVDASGSATVVAALPEGVTAVSVAAITDEPIGGSLQPTGTIHLKGETGQ